MARGRPRTFDTEQALEAAQRLFWRHGYEGTSLAMLTEAMQINVPSLYAAFGNKESLFRQSLDRYIDTQAQYLHRALAKPTARQVAEEALRGAINLAIRPANPAGCMLVRSGVAGGPESDFVRQELSARRAMAEAAVHKRFERALNEGDLPRNVRPAQLARFLMTMIWGLSVQAAGGASRAHLKDTAAMALRAWPTK